jgi:hypothetical protein
MVSHEHPDGVTFQRQLTFFDTLPKRLGQDVRLRYILYHPSIGLVEPRDALPGFGILDVAQAVPDEPSDMEFAI